MESKETKANYGLFVFRFLGLWLISLVFLFAIILLADINWAKPQIQKAMEYSLHRKVALGKLGWSFGFDGLAISSDKFAIREYDGEPFCTAGQTEIGVAFWPLTHGKVILHYVSLQNPEFWALRLSPNRWNFSDLLDSQVDIRFLKFEHGRLHVLDLAGNTQKAHWPDYNFDDVKLKLVFPQKRHGWPFFLSFDLKRPKYTSHVSISATGHGNIADWQTNKYQFEIHAKDIRPQDLSPFLVVPKDLDGLFTVDAFGRGMLASGMKAQAWLQASKLSLPTSELGLVKLPQLTLFGKFDLDPDQISWSELQTQFGDVNMSLAGHYSGWQKHPVALQTTEGNSFGLDKFWKSLGFGTKRQSTIEDGGKQDKLQSKFHIEVGDSDWHRLLVFPKPKSNTSLTWSEVLAPQALKQYPMIPSILSKAGTKMEGEFRLDSNQALQVPKAEITYGKTSVSGSYLQRSNANANRGLVRFASTKARPEDLLSFLEGEAMASRDAKASANWQFLHELTSPETTSGTIGLNGQIDLAGNKQSTNLAIDLQNTTVSVLDSAKRKFSPSNMTGQIKLEQDKLSFNKVRGTISGATFELTGETKPFASPANASQNLSLSAQHLDLADLSSAFDLLHFDLNVLKENQLTGRAKQFSFAVSGTAAHPNVEFSLEPEEIHYQIAQASQSKPQAQSHPLTIDSGMITLRNHTLIMENCGFATNIGKVVASIAINNLDSKPQLVKVRGKSNGLDLTELNSYLTSPVIPESVRNSYASVLAEHGISNLAGRASGAIFWQLKPKDQKQWKGQINLQDVSCNLSESKSPLKHLSGTLFLSGPDILVQGVNGNLGNTSFSLVGQVKSWQSEKYNWTCDMNAEIAQSELQELVNSTNCEISYSGTLGFHGKASGSAKAAEAHCLAKFDGDDNLHIVSPLITFSQPAGQALAFDGSIAFNWQKNLTIAFSDSQLTLGQGAIAVNGQWTVPTPETRSVINIDLRVTQPLDGQFLSQAFCLTKEAGTTGGATAGSGTLAGQLSLTGTQDNIASEAQLQMHALTLPNFGLSHINATCELSSGANNPKHIVIDRLSAQVADGKATATGWFDLDSTKMHAAINLTKVDANKLLAGLSGYHNELVGTASATMILDSQGKNRETIISNLSGTGNFIVAQGKISRFGHLQERLNQANFVQQGIFGFNLNNLLQTFVPVRTGEFKELSSTFAISKGIVDLSDMRFAGSDMRLWAVGKLDLPQNTLRLDIAGNIPRVSSSILSGPIGQMSRDFTIQNFVNTITMGKLEGLPGLPILGDIASNNPRTFEFAVVSPINKPDLMAKSIEKTFRWLPNRPNASAHPIPTL